MSGPVSDKPHSHGSSRPSLDTEAVSADEGGGDNAEGGYEEIQVDVGMLDPSCLVPPTIPNTLGAEDIDKVIAALTNVPDVKIPDGLLSGEGKGERSSVSQEKREFSYEAEGDYDRKRNYYDNYDDDDRGRFRGRGRGRGRGGGYRGGRGGWNEGGYRGGRGGFRGEWVDRTGQARGRAKIPVARGRNIFPAEEERGRGRGRVRVNNLYKRFKQQHRDASSGGGGGGDRGELYNDGYGERRFEDGRSYSRSRSRSRGRKKHSSTSSSRSSSSSSSSSPKKKKKKKDKKHKKKKKGSAKKKKRDASSDNSDSDQKGEDLDWRVELLKKMKDIKNLPPEQLETEFKKAMAEKKRKEEEEKCIGEIKNRQKMARKVKKESERAAKRAAKEKKRESKSKGVSEERTNDGFYNGLDTMDLAMAKMEEETNKILFQTQPSENQFKSSFAEVPFVPEDGNPYGENEVFEGVEGENHQGDEELDPYAKAMQEQMKREPKDDIGGDVSWPAGAIENAMDQPDYDNDTKEQVEAAQEAMENEAMAIDDKTKNVMNTSKMFSKIRNRIKGKPLKIHLKSNKLSTEDDEGLGLQPVNEGEATPGEGLSGEEQTYGEESQYGYYEGGYGEYSQGFGQVGDEYDVKQESVEINDEEEERRVARYRERARRRRERALETGELEDGEHSPSPEPERPHHRRRRKRRHEKESRSGREGRDGTPLLDEQAAAAAAAGGLEEGEIGGEADNEEVHKERSRHGNQSDRSRQGHSSTPSSNGGQQGGFSQTMLGGPPPAIPFLDTSVPPPNIGVGGGPSGFGRPQMERAGSYGGLDRPAHQYPPVDRPAPYQPVLNTPPTFPPKQQPPYFPPPNTSYQPPAQNYSTPNTSYEPPSQNYSRTQQPSPNYPPYQPPYHPINKSPQPSSAGDMYNAYSSPTTQNYQSRTSLPPAPPPLVPPVKSETGTYYDTLPVHPRPSTQLEQVDSEEEDSVDITKVSPIMKYIAGKLQELKYHLELDGPFRYRSDIPGLSPPLFVAYKMVTMLEAAGYDGSKMYMSAMFPQGMADTKTALVGLVTNGKLDPRIKGSKLTKMCVRCIRCFLAYYTGKNDDIDTSDGECSEESGAEMEVSSRSKHSKTVTTSLMDVLGRIKESDTVEAPSDPLGSVLSKQEPAAAAHVQSARYSVEDNPWSTMELDMRSNNLKTFTALQSHFTKQLVGKGMDHRDAREQASESMMCFVVANFSDMMLRDMVQRYRKVILPEQSQLEVTRYGLDRTLFDQIVDKLLKHQAEFPLSILQEVRREEDWKSALLKKMRNIVERMLKFYMRGLGKLQDGKDVSGQVPNDPAELQFNYLPEGLREEENKPIQPVRQESNFFNMEQAAVANRSFSSYKRLSLDEQALSPVSPDSSSKGSLARSKYLFGTFYVDTLLYQGSSYVYELGVYMSDSSSIEVYIVPTKLFKQNSVLEMLGFSFNPDEKKYIYMKPGSGGFSKTYSEEHGLERIMQFLKEKRFESRGDSENRGLVLTAQNIEDLATWVKFSSFHGKDWELRDIVSGYGCLDLFIEESKGMYSYAGPKLHREREANQTYFTWEYQRVGSHREAMSAGKADALYTLLERLLDNRPSYENFIKTHCFTVNSRQYQEIERRFEIIKDMYNLEYHLATSLNVRAEKRRLYTEGIFCPRTTAELGDRPGLVAARMVRILAELGYSRHSLKNFILEGRERGGVFTLPGVAGIIARMRNPEDREKCESQIAIVTKYIEDYFLRR